ncbi:MAG: hypothetical protein IRZ21_04645 [Thermoleophilaceae bacterium]|nr:hypothetical protein [Thermoleophilaceae bacterium]
MLGLLLPLAHAGHVLVTLPIYLGPVLLLIVGLKVAERIEKRRRTEK